MSTNNNATIPTPRFANAPGYSLQGIRDETDIDAIRRFTWALWDVADWSTRGPVILRVSNHDHLPGAVRALIEMFIDSPDKFRQLMLMYQGNYYRHMTERALDAMRRENIAVRLDDTANWRWVELNVPAEK